MLSTEEDTYFVYHQKVVIVFTAMRTLGYLGNTGLHLCKSISFRGPKPHMLYQIAHCTNGLSTNLRKLNGDSYRIHLRLEGQTSRLIGPPFVCRYTRCNKVCSLSGRITPGLTLVDLHVSVTCKRYNKDKEGKNIYEKCQVKLEIDFWRGEDGFKGIEMWRAIRPTLYIDNIHLLDEVCLTLMYPTLFQAPD